MKQIKLTIIVAAVLVLAMVVGSASAQVTPAYDAPITSSITYQNVGSGPANVVFNFYSEASGNPITYTPSEPLAAGAGGSVFVGNLGNIASGFSGSAVASSDQPIVATMVQIFDGSSGVKNRPLSNGFDGGASEVLLATVLKDQFNSTTVFSVQNTGTTPTNVTVELFNADNPGGDPITLSEANLPGGAAKYFDMGQAGNVPSPFNGSAVITASSGEIVATALELSTNSTGSSAFEGVSAGSSTVYMAAALCNAFGGQTSAYAVQNTGDNPTQVTVTYTNADTGATTTDNGSIQPGAKQSFNACTVNSDGFNGSAVIEAPGGEVVAIGKVFGTGLSTAFVGSSSGSQKLALPYVRYSESDYNSGNRQRAFIAIQNVGNTELPANSVTVKYLNASGTVVGEHQLGAMAPSAKLGSHARHGDVTGNASDLQEFGYIGGFGGGAIIESTVPGSQLVAVVRVVSRDLGNNQTVGEDYSGIAID